ncbi:MAG: FAD-binding oxidoreductase [Candidatus Eremiobacteraeota bacterium]|nr:FAD-binding oxidoreductase [Candidatus Eremiobacteraeota bacterium]
MARLKLPFDVSLPHDAGSRPRIHPTECARYAVGDQTPKVVFSPRTAAEAAKVITAVRREGATINVRGAGSKSHRPPAPRALDTVVDMSRCSGILEHTPADLTATVAAGTPFAELQAALRAHGQFFPCDPAWAAQATVGGTLAARVSGALRLRYGGLRDNVLGMRVCLSDGSIAFSGAKVVKSVAGYDAAKLFVGAFGTLGVIAEVSLKVAPLPASECLLVAPFDTAEAACDAALRIAGSALFVMAITLHGRTAALRIRALETPANSWTLCVRCGGTRGAVARQREGAARMCSEAGSRQAYVLEADRVAHAWNDVAESAGGSLYDASRYLVLKTTCLPTQSPVVVHELTATFANAEISLQPASGIVYAHVPIDTGDVLARAAVAQLLQKCTASQWSVEFLSAPPALRDMPQPPAAASALPLMRRIKAALDPSGTFDPGGFLAGI